MANFNAMFAGCESFMEGDVEINNDVTVPASDGEALEAESVAEDVGTEGGEIAGEAETEDTKAEAANMVFDQLMNMYTHVKRYGVDRTFLSLYNSDGQLNRMVGYKFPSCESIDSVGSVRSQASRAFIVAMEEDGIFKRIWTWIKETITKVYNFFIKVMDWFREACGNLDLRVGKLYKYFKDSAAKRWGDIKDKSVKYIEKSAIDRYKDKQNTARRDLTYGIFNTGKRGLGRGTLQSNGNDLTEQIATISKSMSTRLEDISARIKSESTRTTGVTIRLGNTYTSYGSTKDKDDKDGVKALKEYVDKINKDVVDPLSDAVSDLNFETKDLNDIADDDLIFANVNFGGVSGTANNMYICAFSNNKLTKPKNDDSKDDSTIKEPVMKMLEDCKKVLTELLKQKQAMDMMNLANAQAKKVAEQESRLAGNGSLGYEEQKDARLATMGIVKCNSILARITTLNEKIVAKCCTLAASLQGCVNPNSATK